MQFRIISTNEDKSSIGALRSFGCAVLQPSVNVHISPQLCGANLCGFGRENEEVHPSRFERKQDKNNESIELNLRKIRENHMTAPLDGRRDEKRNVELRSDVERDVELIDAGDWEIFEKPISFDAFGKSTDDALIDCESESSMTSGCNGSLELKDLTKLEGEKGAMGPQKCLREANELLKKILADKASIVTAQQTIEGVKRMIPELIGKKPAPCAIVNDEPGRDEISERNDDQD